MTEFEEAISKLEAVKKVGSGYVARCPAHDDRIQSLSIKDSNGKALLYCHANCTYESIIKALDLKTTKEKPELKEIESYNYTDIEGNLIYQVVRFYPKAFKQRKPDGSWGLGGIKPVLYNLPEVVKAVNEGIEIYYVEGEKDVHRLKSEGLVATTMSGGSSTQISPQNMEYLYKAVLRIIPDNDKPGKEYAIKIANQLYGWCKSLKIIELPVPIKGDISDYLEDHDTKSLTNISRNTKEYIPIGAVTRDEYNALKGMLHYIYGRLRQTSTPSKDINLIMEEGGGDGKLH